MRARTPDPRQACGVHALQAGFSLVEVMIALLILAVGVVGLTQGVATALRSSKESELQTTAALIAAGQIETLRADGFLVDGEETGACGDGLDLYRWRQTVAKSAIEGLHEITVVVENANSGQAIYELKTLLFDPPLGALENPASRGVPTRERKGGVR